MAPKNQRWWLTDGPGRAPHRAPTPTCSTGWSRTCPASASGAPSASASSGRATSPSPWRAPPSSGHNAVGPGRRIRYSRHGRVLVAEPGREFAFITDEGGRESTVWRYPSSPTATARWSPRRYEVRWIPTWARILDVPTNRHKELLRGHAHHARAPRGRRRGEAGGAAMTDLFTATPGVDVITHHRRHPRPSARSPSTPSCSTAPSPSSSTPAPSAGRDDFLAALRSVIDPADLRWIWLTHTDFDHIGSLADAARREPAAAGASRPSSASASWACRRRRCRWTASTSSTRASRSPSATARSPP